MPLELFRSLDCVLAPVLVSAALDWIPFETHPLRAIAVAGERHVTLGRVRRHYAAAF